MHHFLYDGHGSTRALLNSSGGIVSGEVYSYDAFGNPIGFVPSTALTSILYSGELTDATGLQYLRARYYDPATGTFNRLDPFAGNMNDPQSLHKYLYAHADPINGIDPTGESAALSFLAVIGARLRNAVAVMGTFQKIRWSIYAMVGAYTASLGVYSAYTAFGYPSLIPFNAGGLPSAHLPVSVFDEVDYRKYEANVYRALMRTLSSSGNSANTAKAKTGARRIAEAFVEMVKRNNNDGPGGWWQSVDGSGPNCSSYAGLTMGSLIDPVIQQSGWKVRVHYDIKKGGYPQHATFGYEKWRCVPLHSVVSVTYQGRIANGKISTPDWIFDPWANNKPDIFPYSEFQNVWPIPEVDPNL